MIINEIYIYIYIHVYRYILHITREPRAKGDEGTDPKEELTATCNSLLIATLSPVPQ